MKKNECLDCFKKADWIGLKSTENVLEFQRTFFLSSLPKEATLLISGLGFFDAELNKKPLDSYFYKPEMLDYHSREKNQEPHLFLGSFYSYPYMKYDLLTFLKQGENLFSIYLGNGYYQNTDRPYEPFKGSYGDKCLRYALLLTYSDGTKEVISSDKETLVRKTALFCGLYRGNKMDFSAKEEPFVQPDILQGPEENPVEQSAPLDIQERIEPTVLSQNEGSLLLDFKVNHSGGVHLFIQGKKGQKIRIGHAEALNSDSSLDYETSHYEEVDPNDPKIVLDSIDQISEYTLSGSWDEIKPTFSWYCYRYVKIENLQGAKVKDLYSLFLHADMKKRASFSSSIPLFEEIEDKTIRTILDNTHAGLITDCPHREKRPYTGDGNIIEESALYALDAEGLYAKWLKDIIHSQTKDGFIPYTAPHLAGGGGYAWSYAIATVPDILYRLTGKKEYIEESYPSLLRFLSFCENRCEDGILKGNGIDFLWCLGDWSTPENAEFNIPYMSSACYYRSLDIASFFAGILNKEDDQKKLEKRKQKLQESITEHFYHMDTHSYCQRKQGEDALALAFGFYPKEEKEALKKTLREDYAKKPLDTGMVMTPILFDALFQNDMADIAISLLTQKGYPSYSDMLKGETTISETWSKHQNPFYDKGKLIIQGGNEISRCHPMFGSILSKLYRYVAGMDLSNLYQKEILLDPKATSMMDYASLTMDLPNGKTSLSWKKDKEALTISFTIPKGLKGRYKGKSYPEGSYTFQEKLR